MQKAVTLTSSQIRYLLVLKKLNKPEGIRVSDIAVEMRLSKPSVHNMMDTFKTLDFVKKKPGGQVLMTECGMHMAMEYAEHFERIKGRLSALAAVDASLDTAICAFLAELSDECLDALARAGI